MVAASNAAEAASIFSGSLVQAVVLGDSLNREQGLDLARTLKKLNSSVPIVALIKTGTQIPAALVDEQVESLADPRLLLEALVRVLPADGDR